MAAPAGLLLYCRAGFEGEGGMHVVQEERDKNPQAIWVDASTTTASSA